MVRQIAQIGRVSRVSLVSVRVNNAIPTVKTLILESHHKPPQIDPPFRLKHIGSLVRPPAILAARAKHANGGINDGALRDIENAEIKKIVRWQVLQGFRVITDGEFRRDTYRQLWPGGI